MKKDEGMTMDTSNNTQTLVNKEAQKARAKLRKLGPKALFLLGDEKIKKDDLTPKEWSELIWELILRATEMFSFKHLPMWRHFGHEKLMVAHYRMICPPGYADLEPFLKVDWHEREVVIASGSRRPQTRCVVLSDFALEGVEGYQNVVDHTKSILLFEHGIISLYCKKTQKIELPIISLEALAEIVRRYPQVCVHIVVGITSMVKTSIQNREEYLRKMYKLLNYLEGTIGRMDVEEIISGRM